MSKLFKILAVLLALAAIVCTGVTAWNMHEKYTQEQAVVNDLKSQIANLTKREKESAVMQSVKRLPTRCANMPNRSAKTPKLQSAEPWKLRKWQRNSRVLPRRNVYRQNTQNA